MADEIQDSAVQQIAPDQVNNDPGKKYRGKSGKEYTEQELISQQGFSADEIASGVREGLLEEIGAPSKKKVGTESSVVSGGLPSGFIPSPITTTPTSASAGTATPKPGLLSQFSNFLSRITSEQPNNAPDAVVPIATPQQIQDRIAKLQGKAPTIDNTNTPVNQLKSQLVTQDNSTSRLNQLLPSVTKSMAEDHDTFFKVDRPKLEFNGVKPDASYTTLNTGALDNLLSSMKDANGNPLRDDDKQNLRNRISQNVESAKMQYDVVQNAKKNYNVDGVKGDPVTIEGQNYAQAYNEANTQAPKQLTQKSFELQQSVNEGKISQSQASNELLNYQKELNGSLDDIVKQRVQQLNKQMGLGAVYQEEIDALKGELGKWDKGSVRYQMAESRLNKLQGMQQSGEYAADEDKNWQRSMEQGYKQLVISNNEKMKDVFNHQGLNNETLSYRAPLGDLRNNLSKQVQGLFNGVGALEQMAGGVMNMMGAYTVGNAVTQRGKDFAEANNIPLPIDAQGNQQVVDNPSTWIARNASAQIPLMAALVGTSEFGGEALGGLAEGLGVVSKASPFMKGFGGGLIASTPESLMEAADYYNQAIAQGKTVNEANDKAHQVFLENQVMTAFTNPLEFGLMKTKAATSVGKLFSEAIEPAINGGQEVVQNWIQEHQDNPSLSIADYALSPEGQSAFISGAAVGILQKVIIDKFTTATLNRNTNQLFDFNKQYRNQYEDPSAAAPLPNNKIIANTVLNAYKMSDSPNRTKQLKTSIDRLEASGAYSEDDANAVKSIIDDVNAVKSQIPKYGSNEQQTAVFNELLQIHINNRRAKESGIKTLADRIETYNNASSERINKIMEGTEPLYFVNGNEVDKEGLIETVDKSIAAGVPAKNLNVKVIADPETSTIIKDKLTPKNEEVATNQSKEEAVIPAEETVTTDDVQTTEGNTGIPNPTPPTEQQIIDDLTNKRVADFTFPTEESIPPEYRDRIKERNENSVVAELPQSVGDYYTQNNYSDAQTADIEGVDQGNEATAPAEQQGEVIPDTTTPVSEAAPSNQSAPEALTIQTENNAPINTDTSVGQEMVVQPEASTSDILPTEQPSNTTADGSISPDINGFDALEVNFDEPTIGDRAKSIADKLRGYAKIVDAPRDVLNSNPFVIPRAALASAMRLSADVIEAGGKVADAIVQAVAHIRNLHPEISEVEAREDFVNELVNAGVKNTTKQTTPTTANNYVTPESQEKEVAKKMSDLKRQIKAKYKYLAEGASKGFKEGLVKGFVRGINKGYKTGLNEGSQVEKDAQKVFEEDKQHIKDQINEILNDAQKRGVFNGEAKASKIKLIATTINKANSLTSLIRAMDKVQQIIETVDYEKNINIANDIRKDIIKTVKGISMERAASNVAVAKAFAKLNPSNVDDLPAYIHIANRVLSTNKAMSAKVKDGVAIVSNATNDASNQEVKDYTEKQLTAIEEKAKQKLADTYQNLVDIGVLDPTAMSLDDMKKAIEATKGNQDDMQAQLDSLKAERDEKKRAMQEVVQSQQSELSDHVADANNSATYTEAEHAIVDNLLNLDTSKLTVPQLIKVNDIINNIVANNEFFGSGETAAISEALRDVETLQEKIKASGINLNELKNTFTRNFTSVALMTDFIAKSSKLAAEIQRLTGIQDVFAAHSRATLEQGKTLEAYQKLKKDLKKAGKDIDSAENRYTRGIYAKVIQNLNGTAEENQEEFDRQKSFVRDTYEKLNASEIKSERQEGKLVESVYNKILESAKKVADVEAAVSEPNKKLVNFWIDKFASNADKVEKSAEIYDNTILDRYNNYTSTRAKGFNGGTVNEEIKNMFEDANLKKQINDNPSRTKINRVKGDALAKNAVYDYDFDALQSRRYFDTVYDVEASPAIAKVKAFFKSDQSSSVLGGVRNRQLMYTNMENAVNTQRGSITPLQEIDRNAVKALSIIQAKGARVALGSVFQLPKQYLSVASSALINLGQDAGLYFKAVHIGTALKLFEQSSIGIRGGTKAGNSRETDIASIDRTNFGNSAKEVAAQVLETGRKVGDIIMSPLVWSDVKVARQSWLAYYMQDLQRQGVDVDKVDWDTEHERYNKEAGAYAEQMVSRTQNANNNTELGAYIRDVRGLGSVVRNLFLPFSNFSTTQRLRFANDIQKILWGGDKQEAWKSLAGTFVEQGVFNALKVYVVGSLTTAIARGIAGKFGFWDDDDKEKAEKREGSWGAGSLTDSLKFKRFAGNTMSDFLFSGMGSATQTVLQKGSNALYGLLRTAQPTEEEPNPPTPTLFYTYEPSKMNQPDFALAGMFGIIFQNINNVYQQGGKAIKGTTDMVVSNRDISPDADATQLDKTHSSIQVPIDPDERKMYEMSLLINSLAIAGLSEAEISNVNRKIMTLVDKKMKARYGGKVNVDLYAPGSFGKSGEERRGRPSKDE